uniref:LysM domain-containing protein n=1 Tax=Hanusia phi TaxID=3032 RepID=A0A7S0E851_9CRYP|mmetsp:Transcript_17819/g.40367  ORF Transcript_17819/g.40367 Transcript_17819/m.40367 type:complete len:871 (+) Transcript_17819:78-2690(+)
MNGKLLLLLCIIIPCHGQFRGGSLAWEVLDYEQNLVRFTLRSAWIRSSGMFVKVVNGIAVPMDGYQPVVGDVVRVLGRQTPKFLFEDSYEDYLHMTVTQNTYPFGFSSTSGHYPTNWTFLGTNWIEGTSTWDIKVPSKDKTYMAELQGCCRDVLATDSNAVLARGVLDQAETPFVLRTTVNLKKSPPPLSFMPFYAPFFVTATQINSDVYLELPFLDYNSTFKSAPSTWNHQDEAWANDVDIALKEEQGNLVVQPPIMKQYSNILQPADTMDQNTLPPLTPPKPVATTVSFTGMNVGLLRNPSSVLTLFPSDSCTGTVQEQIIVGKDICPGGPVQNFSQTGQGIQGSLRSIMVPQGLSFDLVDACEYSETPVWDLNSANPFYFGNVLQTCNNMDGTHSCCTVSSSVASQLRGFRLRDSTSKASPAILNMVQIQNSMLVNGRYVIKLVPRSLAAGRYPISCTIASEGSAVTTIEFVLSVFQKLPNNFFTPQSTMNYPQEFVTATGFPFNASWLLNSEKTFTVFDNLEASTWGSNRPVAKWKPVGASNSWFLEWPSSPCVQNTGMYFYCFTAVMQTDSHEWENLKCVLIRVVQDLAPRISVFESSMPDQDANMYSVFMGERLELVVKASDNPQDVVEVVGLTKLDVNTGDRFRGRIRYESVRVDQVDGRNSLFYPIPGYKASIPRLTEIQPHAFLSLSIGGPRNLTQALMVPYEKERVISFVPTRLHSGLNFSMCFLAIDSRGLCRPYGSGSQRCIQIYVPKCQYALSQGSDLTRVAGLFRTNWIQLFTLNPWYTTPESALASDFLVVDVGKLYKISPGETLAGIADLMGTDLQSIQFFNTELAPQREPGWMLEIVPGKEICVLPESCKSNV